jgi:spore cortex protein
MNKRFPWIKGMLITGLLFTAVGCTTQAGVNPRKSTPQNYHPARVSYNTGNGMNPLPGTMPLNTGMGNTTGVGNTTGIGNTTGVGNATTQNPSTQQIQLADPVANSLAELKTVQSACALVKDQNAYVSVVLEPAMKQLTNDVRKDITNCVKQVNPSVQNVYISNDPQFCKQMYDCTMDLRMGQSVGRSTKNMDNIIHRMFPQAR